MSHLRLVTERVIDAPADVVYRCLADYVHHHRPGGFLPPAFSNFQVLEGGLGAGTVIRFNVTVAGRTRSMTQSVTEPAPGRVLVEDDQHDSTIFTVEPDGQRCLVRFDTRLETRGLSGLMTRLFAPRLLRPVFTDELEQLERYAQAQLRVAA